MSSYIGDAYWRNQWIRHFTTNSLANSKNVNPSPLSLPHFTDCNIVLESYEKHFQRAKSTFLVGDTYTLADLFHLPFTCIPIPIPPLLPLSLDSSKMWSTKNSQASSRPTPSPTHGSSDSLRCLPGKSICKNMNLKWRSSACMNWWMGRSRMVRLHVFNI